MQDSARHDSEWHIQLVSAALATATFAVYFNSLGGPFVFDDLPSIVANPTIRHLWPLSTVLSPSVGETVGGRPLVNLTLALNYAISGLQVWSYHLFNILIHVLTGLTLFGVLRRTLSRVRTDGLSLLIASAASLIWLMHPLQTESVTYVVQRAESLASLCYLLTLYCTIRATESTRTGWWSVLAVVACFAGMGCKETMVSAPLIVLLYDRTFYSGSFSAAWQKRRTLYIGLFSSWLLLAALVATNGRGSTAGFATNITVWSYALTQCRAIVQYIALAAWPHPQIFDYGVAVDVSVATVAWRMAIVLLLLVATGYALWRRPLLGFMGVAFFAVLAPSSSVVPVATQTIAEHRMYLPLAVIITMMLLGLAHLIGRKMLYAGLAWALVLGWATIKRNRDYQTDLALWQDTVAKVPENPRAQENLGNSLANLGRPDEALPHFREAVRLFPGYAGTEYNLGRVLAQLGQIQEASQQFEGVSRSDPDFVDASFNDGVLLVRMGRLDDAEGQFENAIATKPDFAGGHAGLGDVLIRLGKIPQAEEQFVKAVQFNPDSADLHVTLGRVLVYLKRPEEAAKHFQMALAIDPELAPVHNELGKIMAHLDKFEDAIAQFEAASRLDPAFTEARDNLELAKKLLHEHHPTTP